MKIGLRSGHSPNCKGAMGILDEQLTMAALYPKVEKILKEYGHTVINCCSTKNNKYDDLAHGVNIANKNMCDIFLSLHMNASNGKGYGTEAWTLKAGDFPSNRLGERLCENFSKLGFKNRGVKHKKEFYEVSKTTMSAVIFETCFCDNKDDTDRYKKLDINKVARLIANGIDPVNIPLESSNTNVSSGNFSPSNTSKTFYRVVVASYKNRNNAENTIKDLNNKGFKDAFIDIYKTNN